MIFATEGPFVVYRQASKSYEEEVAAQELLCGDEYARADGSVDEKLQYGIPASNGRSQSGWNDGEADKGCEERRSG